MIIDAYEREANVLRRRLEFLDYLDLFIQSGMESDDIDDPAFTNFTKQFRSVQNPQDVVLRLKEIYTDEEEWHSTIE